MTLCTTYLSAEEVQQIIGLALDIVNDVVEVADHLLQALNVRVLLNCAARQASTSTQEVWLNKGHSLNGSYACSHGSWRTGAAQSVQI